jgi:DNA-binding MarR family transcriptional regulator
MPPVKPKKIRRKNRPTPKPSPAAGVAPNASASAVSAAPPVAPSSSRLLASLGAVPAPTAAGAEIADQLHSAAIHLLRRLRVRDRESGVGPAQLSALSVLVFGGPKSLGELADAEQVRPPTMSRIVAGLHRSRLIRRHATEDARRVRLEATPKGVALMWEGRQRRVESLAKAVGALRENEKQQLRESVALLQRVIRNL